MVQIQIGNRLTSNGGETLLAGCRFKASVTTFEAAPMVHYTGRRCRWLGTWWQRRRWTIFFGWLVLHEDDVDILLHLLFTSSSSSCCLRHPWILISRHYLHRHAPTTHIPKASVVARAMAWNMMAAATVDDFLPMVCVTWIRQRHPPPPLLPLSRTFWRTPPTGAAVSFLEASEQRMRSMQG